MESVLKVDNALAQTSETQAVITTYIAFDMLKQGNLRFLKGEKLQMNYLAFWVIWSMLVK